MKWGRGWGVRRVHELCSTRVVFMLKSPVGEAVGWFPCSSIKECAADKGVSHFFWLSQRDSNAVWCEWVLVDLNGRLD